MPRSHPLRDSPSIATGKEPAVWSCAPDGSLWCFFPPSLCDVNVDLTLSSTLLLTDLLVPRGCEGNGNHFIVTLLFTTCISVATIKKLF